MVAYQPMLHTTAERELNQLNEVDREELTDLLKEICEYESPTKHPKTKPLEGQDGLFRVRKGNVRAICCLDKPHVKIIKVGKRRTVYDGVDTIHERLETA